MGLASAIFASEIDDDDDDDDDDDGEEHGLDVRLFILYQHVTGFKLIQVVLCGNQTSKLCQALASFCPSASMTSSVGACLHLQIHRERKTNSEIIHNESIHTMSLSIYGFNSRQNQKRTIHQMGPMGGDTEHAIIWRSKAMDRQREQHPNYS